MGSLPDNREEEIWGLNVNVQLPTYDSLGGSTDQRFRFLSNDFDQFRLGGIALAFAAQAVPPIARHFSVAWSVCLSSVTFVHSA